MPGSLDIYGALPQPVVAVAATGKNTVAGEAPPLDALRVLRVLRLIKLVRLLKASRVVERWKSKLALSHGTQTLLMCLFGLAIAAHWYSCVLVMMASLHASAEHTWLGDFSFCTEAHRLALEMGEEGSIRGAAIKLTGCEVDLGTLYASGISLAVMLITGTGGSDYLPSSESVFETVGITSLILLGAFLCARPALAPCLSSVDRIFGGRISSLPCTFPVPSQYLPCSRPGRLRGPGPFVMRARPLPHLLRTHLTLARLR